MRAIERSASRRISAEACVAAECRNTFHDECHDDGRQIVACTSDW